MKSEARITTESAGRYMRQLCSHFAHKVQASYTDANGRIEFPIGVCNIQAGLDQLHLLVDAEDAETLQKLEDLIARHLERFAHRENPRIRWVPVS